MQKNAKRELSVKLLVAINKVLTDNKTVFKDKLERAVRKAIRKIVKRSVKGIPVDTASKEKL